MRTSSTTRRDVGIKSFEGAIPMDVPIKVVVELDIAGLLSKRRSRQRPMGEPFGALVSRHSLSGSHSEVPVWAQGPMLSYGACEGPSRPQGISGEQIFMPLKSILRSSVGFGVGGPVMSRGAVLQRGLIPIMRWQYGRKVNRPLVFRRGTMALG